ncbi:MAG: hypothetical protein IK066_07500 [Kiritimatiellae bacterium]|nr:hypothetical protein [Kiritimatiellia bacterium]
MDFLSTPLFADGVGYAASLIILVSLVTANVFRLRLLNGIGSLVFGFYGFLLHSWPVCIINWVIAGIDVWYLVRALADSAFFELAPASDLGAPYLRKFYLYHERDILRFAPEATLEDVQAATTFILLRNLLPVGVFSFRQDGPDARIVLDYAIPQYRDFKAGRFLFRVKRLFFKELGVKRFIATATTPPHALYFRKNGFSPIPGAASEFSLDL